MGSDVVDNYNLGLIPAYINSGFLKDNSEKAYLEQLLDGKGEINKQNVIDHLGQFSCREEMERFVEHKCLPGMIR